MSNREAFEAWMKKEMPHETLKIISDKDVYLNSYAQILWYGFNAGLTSQSKQTDSRSALKVIHGEICYQSTDDDQCYGMWCPVAYDTAHGFAEGTRFIVLPPALEGDKP